MTTPVYSVVVTAGNDAIAMTALLLSPLGHGPGEPKSSHELRAAR